MRTLETERLVLRSWRMSDLDDLYEYAKDPDVGPMAGWMPHLNIQVSEGILRNFIQSGEVWAIALKDSGKVIGSFGLHSDEKRRPADVRMIGYVIGKPYWGRGYVKEAVKAVLDYCFSELNLALVSVCHFPFNQQSRAVIVKCGFTYEGTLRYATQSADGAYHDDVCYAMTREEWAALRQQAD